MQEAQGNRAQIQCNSFVDSTLSAKKVGSWSWLKFFARATGTGMQTQAYVKIEQTKASEWVFDIFSLVQKNWNSSDRNKRKQFIIQLPDASMEESYQRQRFKSLAKISKSYGSMRFWRSLLRRTSSPPSMQRNHMKVKQTASLLS